MKEVTAKSYTLKTPEGQWLGQVVLTSDGMFASVTDYGNFSFAWRAYGTGITFEDFLISLNVDYFANKMYQGMAYVLTSKALERGTERFAEKILPALQAELEKEKAK